MSIIGTVLEDVTTDVLGKIGAWQCLVTLLSASLLVPTFFHTNENLFLLQPSDEITCEPPEGLKVFNLTLCTMVIENNGTQEVVRCDKWKFKLMWLIWQEKSWYIFCEDKMRILSDAMICRLGNLFGSVLLGLLADNFGRRKCIMVVLFAEVGLTLMVMLCNARSWFQLLVFLKALFEGADLYIGIILICEIASNEWRTCLVMLAMIPRILAVMYMVPIANLLPNLESYYLIGFLIGCALLVLLRWIPESPQWLLFNRKINKAEVILKHAAIKNKVTLCSRFSIRPVNQRAYLALDETATCFEVLSTRNIRVVVFISLLFWALFFFQFHSLYVRIYNNYGYTNNFLIKMICFMIMFGVIEFVLSIKLKMKYLLLVNIFIMGALSCNKALQGQLKDSTVNLLLSAPIASGVLAQIIISEITPRFFAINIRCTFFGCCHAAADVGAMISYLLFFFTPASHLTMMVVDVAVMLVLAALCLAFPDTDGRELPDVLEDMDYFSELTKPLRWATLKNDRISLEEVELRVYSFGSNPVETIEQVPARPIETHVFRWLRSLPFIRLCLRK